MMRKCVGKSGSLITMKNKYLMNAKKKEKKNSNGNLERKFLIAILRLW